jgi:nucleoside-diphosphate-sugar epimerase
MKIFLTGATGFLGGKLIKSLLQEGHTLYVMARNLSKAEKIKENVGAELRKGIHIIEGDILRTNLGIKEEIMKTLSDKIDIFYHLAALVKFDMELHDELMQTNYFGTKRALDFAEKIGVKRFFYISTAYTVGKEDMGKEEIYAEEDREYNNPYEESKVKAELAVWSYQDKLDVSIFRPSIIVGDSKTGEADSNFTLYGFMKALEMFKRRLSRREGFEQRKFHLLGSKEGTSNLVPVDYVANILKIAIDNAKKNTIYHITNPNPPTNLEILLHFKKALNFENLRIFEEGKNIELDKEELMLNGMVRIFEPYVNRKIIFKDENTKEMIKGTDVEHLNLTPEILAMIISAYFKFK